MTDKIADLNKKINIITGKLSRLPEPSTIQRIELEKQIRKYRRQLADLQ